MESHSEFEDSDTEICTEFECYDGDGSSVCSITDPASYTERSLTDQDKFQLLTSSMNLPRQYRFPVTTGRKFNPSCLFSRSWLRYSMKNDSCIVSLAFALVVTCLHLCPLALEIGKKCWEGDIAILSSISVVRATRLLKKK